MTNKYLKSVPKLFNNQRIEVNMVQYFLSRRQSHVWKNVHQNINSVSYCVMGNVLCVFL